MKRILIAALLIAACSQHAHQRATAAATSPAVAEIPVAGQSRMPGAGPAKRALWIPMPKDKMQLQRLLAMGYTIHEDHLHAPGVTSCPKMSENPVQ